MNQIRPWLYIGKYKDTLRYSYLSENKIGSMLQLAELVKQPAMVSLYLAIEDGQPLPPHLLEKGVNFIINEKEQGKRVLVACGAGISRSTSFALAALKDVEGLQLLEALQAIREHHPDAMPHPVLWQSLCDFYGEAIPFIEIM